MRRNICIFCASRKGNNPLYDLAAATVGSLIASQGRTLVYGGSNRGYMGTVSAAASNAGGRVVAVIPSLFSDSVINSQRVDELIIVDSMGERKARMSGISDAFLALPGGVGTLDEITDMLTTNQLTRSCKPVGLLNVEGFYDSFDAQMKRLVSDGLIAPWTAESYMISDDPARLLEMMDNFTVSERTLAIMDSEENELDCKDRK